MGVLKVADDKELELEISSVQDEDAAGRLKDGETYEMRLEESLC